MIESRLLGFTSNHGFKHYVNDQSNPTLTTICVFLFEICIVCEQAEKIESPEQC